MGRIGLRTVLQWCVFFCAALTTASIPAAVAQTHAPKIVPPASNAALNSAKDSAPPKTSPPDDPPAPTCDTSAEQPSAEESAAPISDSPSNRAPADDAAAPISDSPSNRVPTTEAAAGASDSPDDFMPADGLPLGGARGVTHPVCLRCPPAQYSYPALLHGVQGNVTLDAIVGTDGWVSDVKILGSLGSGLDEQAMKAVRTWQWKPARDAAGKTVAAHQTVVITFRFPK
ncbi:MAG: TonB family protein [Candidatus Acidiferrales bacterium]